MCGDIHFFQFKTIMGTVLNTAAAMNTDINSPTVILKNSINGAGSDAVTTVYTELFLYENTAAFALRKGTGGTGLSAWGGVAGQAVAGFKASGQPT